MFKNQKKKKMLKAVTCEVFLQAELFKSIRELFTLTGGTFVTPTSLPSATFVRQLGATWGTSGPPLRPGAERYNTVSVDCAENRKIYII